MEISKVFEKFREKGSACISQLFVGEEDAVPEGTSAAVKKSSGVYPGTL